VAVVVLMVLATMAAAVGFLRLQDPVLGLGPDRHNRVSRRRCRICQACGQQQALHRLLSRQP